AQPVYRGFSGDRRPRRQHSTITAHQLIEPRQDTLPPLCGLRIPGTRWSLPTRVTGTVLCTLTLFSGPGSDWPKARACKPCVKEHERPPAGVVGIGLALFDQLLWRHPRLG